VQPQTFATFGVMKTHWPSRRRGPDNIWNVGDQQPVLLLALPQGLFGSLALSNVAGDACDADHLADLVLDFHNATPLTPGDITAYISNLASGGSVFVMGENLGFIRQFHRHLDSGRWQRRYHDHNPEQRPDHTSALHRDRWLVASSVAFSRRP